MPDETQAASSPATPTEYLASLSPTQYAEWKAGKLPEPQASEGKPTNGASAASKEPTKKEEPATSQDQSRKGAESVPGEDKTPGKTAAEPETAQDQEPRKGKKDAQGRILELLAKNKELERKLASRSSEKAEEKKETAQEPEKKPEAKAAAVKETRPKPKQTDKNADGADKYATYDEYVEDLSDWKTEQRFEAYKAEQQALKDADAKAAKENEKKSKETEAQKAWNKKVEEAEKKYPDFKKVALNPDLPIPEGSTVLQFVDNSPYGMDVLQYLGENIDELMQINELSPYEQLQELFSIVASFKSDGEKDEAPSEKEKTTVPVIRSTRTAKPPTEASGRTSAPDDPVEAAVRSRDVGSYMREANRREFAARQKKA